MASTTIVFSTLVLAMLCLVTILHPSTDAFLVSNKLGNLKVAAFHVRYFGPNYMSNKPESVKSLVTILSRYDIFLLQGTRDQTGTSLDLLKAELNSTSGESWDYVASDRLGKTKGSMEQYAYFYRLKSAKLLTTYQVDDKENDLYAREPFCAEFAFVSSSDKHPSSPMHRESVVFVALHTPTVKTRQELEELSKTVKSVASLYPRAAGVVAMGDMNADCHYLSSKWREGELDLFNGEGFHSLIPDSADTVVKSSTDCAYDRVVVYGENLDVRNAKVFDFRSSLNLAESDAVRVSDHFPVEFDLP